jgi:predicted HTH transcriptional regulator
MTTPFRGESQHLDCKSLRLVTGAKADFDAVAQACVCFANAAGGTLLIGIEDDAEAPPADQRVEPALLDRIRKRVGELTVNVQVVPELKRHETDDELLTHYGLAKGDVLTNLGILLVGDRDARASLGSAPIVQAIKYDEREVKVAKWSWDDRTQSPIELIDAIWSEVSDFRESYELPDGMLRTKLPAYDELVVRELIVNAFVHRPY